MGKKLATAVILILLAYCTSNEHAGQSLSIAYQSLVTSLDPISENTVISNSLYCNVYETLVRRDENMKIVPSLAAEWSNPDDRSCILKLRHGIRFHNNQFLTPEDVRFSLERARNDRSSQLASALTMLEKVEVRGSDTIAVITRKPYSLLLNRLSEIWIVPATSKTFEPVGTGPYRISKWKSGSFVSMERNEKYWSEKPSISQVRFDAIPNTDDRIKALLDKKVDILPELEPSSLKGELIKNSHVIIRSTPGLMVLYLAMDVMREKTPYIDLPLNPFRDLRVRKALYQAVNVKRIIREVMKGNATEATQIVAPNALGYNDRIQRLPYNPESARKLLSEAGYPNGFALRMDITNNRYRDDVEVGRAIAKDLGEIGLKVQLNAVDKDILFRMRDARQTSFYMLGYLDASADSGSVFDFLVHSLDPSRAYGTGNAGGYSNSQVDQLIERSSEEMNPIARNDLLESAMKLSMDDFPFIPLYVENNITATWDRIQWQPRLDELLFVSAIRFR